MKMPETFFVQSVYSKPVLMREKEFSKASGMVKEMAVARLSVLHFGLQRKCC